MAERAARRKDAAQKELSGLRSDGWLRAQAYYQFFLQREIVTELFKKGGRRINGPERQQIEAEARRTYEDTAASLIKERREFEAAVEAQDAKDEARRAVVAEKRRADLAAAAAAAKK